LAVTSTRVTTITYTGGPAGTETISAAQNVASPGQISIYTLSAGFASITFPTGGTTVVAATIVPPPGNTQTITLKGITGDTGILLHPTDPTTIALGAGAAFGLTAGGTITGLQIYWT
jgi:hypothetical protein